MISCSVHATLSIRWEAKRPTQLNIYIPKEKARVLQTLDEAARRTGRPKSELTLEALELYLARMQPELGVFHLGTVEPVRRSDLYLERWAS